MRSVRQQSATAVTKLGSVCAALIRRGKSPPSGAQHRGLAPWCRRDAADRVAKAASDVFAVVETGETEKFVAATAACTCRPTRFTRCDEPVHFLPGLQIRFDCSRVCH